MSLFRNRNKKFEDDLQQQLGNHEVKPSGSLWDKLDQELGEGGFEQKVQTKLDNFEMVPYSDTWQKIEAQLPLEPVSNPWLRYLGASLIALLFVSGVYIGYQLNIPSEGAGKQTPGAPRQISEAASEVNVIPANGELLAKETPLSDEESLKTEKGAEKKRAIQHKDKRTTQNDPQQVAEVKQTIVPSTNQTTDKDMAAEAPKRSQKESLPANSTNKKQLLAETAGQHKPSDKTDRKAERKKRPGRQIRTNMLQAATTGSAAAHPVAKTNEPDHASAGLIAAASKTDQPVAAKPEGVSTASAEPQTSPVQNNLPQQPPPASESALPANPSAPPAGVAGNTGTVADPASVPAVSDSAKQAYLAAGKQADEKYDEEKPGKFSVLIMVGGHYSMNDLKAPSSANLPLDENIALRKSIEKPQIDWSGGFYVDYMINDKWRVAAGISMLNFSQQFYYDTKPASGATNGAGESGAGVLFPNDSILGGNTFNTRIRYSWTEFPLLVTYKITNSLKWNIELQGGVSYATLSAVDAAMVSYDNTGLLVLKTADAFPGLQNSVFAILNPAITYTLNEKVAIGMHPTFKYSINSMVKNENWVQQHPYFMGLTLSLRRRF